MAKKAPKGTKVSKEVEFKLTQSDFAEKGKNAASLSKEIRDLDAEFETIKDEFRAKIRDREAKRDDLLFVIHAKKERRMVDTVMVKVFESKEVEYWVDLPDEGWDVVERRSMTEAELQAELNFGQKPKRGRPKKVEVVEKDDPVAEAHANGKDSDVAQTLREETSRRTKSSAVDGPRQ